MFLARNNGNNDARLGLAVPKKHIPKAVDRNRIKRMIREGFRVRQKRLQGKDIVVVIKNRLNVDNESVLSGLHKHWENICK